MNIDIEKYGYSITKQNNGKFAVELNGKKLSYHTDFYRAEQKVYLLLSAEGVRPYEELEKHYKKEDNDGFSFLHVDADGIVWKWDVSPSMVFGRTGNERLGRNDELNWTFIKEQGYRKLKQTPADG